jgi:hypothetical protein
VWAEVAIFLVVGALAVWGELDVLVAFCEDAEGVAVDVETIAKLVEVSAGLRGQGALVWLKRVKVLVMDGERLRGHIAGKKDLNRALIVSC